MARESPSSSTGSLNRALALPAQMVLPLLESKFHLERPPPGTSVPDVTDGVAQDRQRQEP